MAKTASSRAKPVDFCCATINNTMAIEIRLNGEAQELPTSLNVTQMLDFLGLPKERVAVERNRSIVPRSAWERVVVGQGDELEVVHFVGGGSGPAVDALVIAGKDVSLAVAGWNRQIPKPRGHARSSPALGYRHGYRCSPAH
jgi:thiamine biosynthesis protein ThiS